MTVAHRCSSRSPITPRSAFASGCRGTLGANTEIASALSDNRGSKAERAGPENAELADGVDQNAAGLRIAFVAEHSCAPANPEQSFVAIALVRSMPTPAGKHSCRAERVAPLAEQAPAAGDGALSQLVPSESERPDVDLRRRRRSIRRSNALSDRSQMKSHQPMQAPIRLTTRGCPTNCVGGFWG